jgi:hypothetical protein
VRQNREAEVTRKKKYSTGIFQGMRLSLKINEASYLSLLLKYKEEKKYVDDGYDTWTDYCREELGVSNDTIDRRLKALSEFGPEMTGIMLSLGLKWRDIRAIDYVLTEEQRDSVKKGVLQIEGKSIPVEKDRAADIQAVLDLLIDRAAVATKAEKVATAKVDGITKEHKKEVKAMAEEINNLKLLLPPKGDDEEGMAKWAENLVEAVNKAASEFDNRLRVLAFHKKNLTDPRLQAKVIAINTEIEERFKQFVRDYDRHLATSEVE